MVWDPWEEMEKMHRKIDEMFNKAFYAKPLLSKAKELAKFRTPLSNVYETEKDVIAVFEIPGIKKEDINLKITEDNIEVKAVKKEEKELKKKGMYKYEARAGSYYRSVPLPTNIKAEKAKAEYKNGVLRIEIPKKKVKKKAKVVVIK